MNVYDPNDPGWKPGQEPPPLFTNAALFITAVVCAAVDVAFYTGLGTLIAGFCLGKLHERVC